MFLSLSFMHLRLFLKYFLAFCLLISNVVEAQASPQLYQATKHPGCPTYQAARTKLHNLLHTKLDINFDWKKQHLHGIATLQVQAHFYPQSQLILDAQNLVIHQVSLLEDTNKRALKYHYDHKQLVIDLDRPYTKEEPCWVEIHYTASGKQNHPTSSSLLNAPQGLFFINPDGQDSNRPQQIWTQGEPNTSSCWFPTIDAPNQKCTQEMYLTVDERFKTLSNGVLVYTTLNEDQTRTDYWSMDLPHAPYLFMLAVGEFAEVEDEWNDIPVNYYVAPAYKPYAKAIFGRTPEMLEFFSEKLDYPYPWPKYSQVVVQDYLAAGMENTTAVVLSDAFQMDERELLDSNHEDILAHELFHHWFGNLVTCESWAHVVLNESLACLGTHLWKSHQYGQYASERDIWQTLNNYLEEAKSKQVSLIRPYYQQPIELFDHHSYYKGTLVFHMLRNYLGEEAFWQSLSHYLKKHAFTSVDIHQLRKAFEEITGEDLNWFFNQWFLAPGHPILQAEHTYTNGKVTLKVWQKQTAPSPIYQLPLSVDIWVKGQKRNYQVLLDKTYQEFKWDAAQRPELVYIDRQAILVGELEHPQSPEETLCLYHYGDNFFAQYEALSRLIKNNKNVQVTHYTLLGEALQNKFWFFRVMAIEALAGYQEKNTQDISERLIKVVQEDDHAAVRGAALRTLSTLPNSSQYTEVYKASLADSSYQVVSMALDAYAKTSADSAKVNVLAEMEKYDNPDIIIALANYYITSKQPGKYAWLKDKVVRLYHRQRFEQLIPLLAQYASLVADSQAQEDSRILIQAISQRSATSYLQLAIQNALKRLPKTKTIKK
jgi:aminopeptidase N